MTLLYQKYSRPLSSYISRKIDDPLTVEELVNDVLYAAHQSHSTFTQKSSEFTWICSIANHKIIDYFRKKKLKTILFSANPYFEEIVDQALTPERDVLKNELKTEIQKTLSDLGAGYHQILRLKYIDGLKIGQIARLLKVSAKAIESRLIRAKKKFRLSWLYETSPSKDR